MLALSPLSLQFQFKWGSIKKTRKVIAAAPSPLPPPTKILKIARDKFISSLHEGDSHHFSLAKALLLVAVEDEAFISFHRDLDKHSVMKETEQVSSSVVFQSDDLDDVSLAGRSMSSWISELDTIAKQVEAELPTCSSLMEVVDVANRLLSRLRGSKRPHQPPVDSSKFSYLHTVLSIGCGSALMFSIIYIEICQRLGISIIGSRVEDDFFISTKTNNLEESLSASSANNWFSVVNGAFIEHSRLKAFDLDNSSLVGLDSASNRDILGFALANLVRLYWKKASRMKQELILTSPLRPIISRGSGSPMLRPQELGLAVMASERLLILQPHSWSVRRDHGMLLYYSRRYAEAVQELSICMAFSPVEELEVMEPFVEKLHLLRLESSWNSTFDEALAL